jgi:hypothetical protein
MVIVPFFNFFNHDPKSNVEWFCDSDDNWVLRTKAPVFRGAKWEMFFFPPLLCIFFLPFRETGQELTINYGCRTNVDYFSTYGFFLPRNSECDALSMAVQGRWMPVVNWRGVVKSEETLHAIFDEFVRPQLRQQHDGTADDARFDYEDFDHVEHCLTWIRDEASKAVQSLKVEAIPGSQAMVQAYAADRRQMIESAIKWIDNLFHAMTTRDVGTQQNEVELN